MCRDTTKEDLLFRFMKTYSVKEAMALKTNEDRSKERKESIETAFSGVQENGKCRISELAEYIGKSESNACWRKRNIRHIKRMSVCVLWRRGRYTRWRNMRLSKKNFFKGEENAV